MTTSADIFEALAACPDRSPTQRAQDRASAAILRDREALFPTDEEETWTADEVEGLVNDRMAEILADLIEELPASSKRARELLAERAAEFGAAA